MLDFLFKSTEFNEKYLSAEGKKIVAFMSELTESIRAKVEICREWQDLWDTGKIKNLEKELDRIRKLSDIELNKDEFVKTFLEFISNLKKLYEVVGEDIANVGRDILSDEEKLKDILANEYRGVNLIYEKIEELKAVWNEELEFFEQNKENISTETNTRKRLYELIEREERIFNEIKPALAKLLSELQDEIKVFSSPTIADRLEFKFDETVQQISKRLKTTMVSREGYLVLCPNCMDTDSRINFDKKQKLYVCSKCGASLTKEEFEKIANIENVKGVLVDFNIRKDVQGHLVLDHHDGLDKGNIMVTATTQVIDYIKLIKKDSRLSSFKLLKMYYQRIMQFAKEGRLNLFASHLDLDMFLAQFAFRNPNTALKYEEILTKLSRYGDLMKIDKSVKRYYLIIQGYLEYLKLKLGKKESVILEVIVREMRNILKYPSKYKKFEEEEKIRLDTAKNVLDEWSQHFKPILGYENYLLEYISSSDVKRVDAIYEILIDKHGGAFNNPLIINLPLVVKTNPKHTNFNLAVNPNKEGFENLNLTVFREPLESAEEKKINSSLSQVEEVSKKIDEKNDELKRLKGNKFVSQLSALKGKLVKMPLPKVVDELNKLQESEIQLSSRHKDEDLEKIRSIISGMTSKAQAFKDDNQKKALFGDFKKIEQVLFLEVPQEVKKLEGELKKFPKKKDLEKRLKENRGHNVWRIKPNLIIINPKYPTMLTFEEILKVITSNLGLLSL